MKINLTFFIILITLASAQGQFIVFKTTGNIQYFSAKTKQWETLKPKDSITSDTKIKRLPNSSLMLIDSKYRCYTVNREGEFLLKNGMKTSNSSNSKEMQKAVKFFVEQTFAANSNGNRQKAKGAVYRGEESIFPWDSSIILEDTFNLTIRLPKGSYPVKVTLNNYSLLIYNDTTLKIPSITIKENGYDILKIGSKREIHLKRETKDRELILSYIETLTDSKNKPNAANYALAVLNCIDWGYLPTARLIIEEARSDRELYKDLMGLIKHNPTALELLNL